MSETKPPEDYCPTCGALMQRWRLGLALTNNVLSVGRERIDLTNHQATIMDALIRHWPFTVTKDRLLYDMWNGMDEPETSESSLWSQLSKLRVKLKPLGYEIKCMRSRGYHLQKIEAAQSREAA